jgi:para-aminobenzoate synthetase component 1
MPDAPDMHATSGPRPAHRWIARQWFTASGALVAEAAPGVSPWEVFTGLAGKRHALFLDTAQPDAAESSASHEAGSPAARLGRYSFVAVDPIHSVHVEQAGDPTADARGLADAFARLRTLLADLRCPTIPGLPPFQGGVGGLVSYECGLARLGVRSPGNRDPDLPLLSLHVYDVVFAFDHDLDRGWFISQGVPAVGPRGRQARAAERLAAVLAAESVGVPPPSPSNARAETAHASAGSGPIPGGSHPLPRHPGILSTHSRDSYLDMVRAGIEFVRAGDIFQANLAQRFTVAVQADPVAVYSCARRMNPAPFAGLFDVGRCTIASMSPERFLQVTGGIVRMHPIKGTRRMIASPEADLYAGDDLEASGKDRAENVMIVDLVRNDLARVCTPASVHVESLCRLERYRYVQHLVSIVAGRLRPHLGALDALDAAIPGGSVTGAPKHRACEIISELEGVARGAYCGSLGFIGFDGAADFNLLIRTFVVGPHSITFAAGGGITAASDPAAEHAESLHKAEGMLRVLDALGIAPAGGATREAAP